MAFDFLGTFSRGWFNKLFKGFFDPYVEVEVKNRASHCDAEAKRLRKFQSWTTEAKQAKQATHGDVQWLTKYDFPISKVAARGARDDGDVSIQIQDVTVQAREPLRHKHEKLEYQGKNTADATEQVERTAAQLRQWTDLKNRIKSLIESMFASGQHTNHLFEDGQVPLTLAKPDTRYKSPQPTIASPPVRGGGTQADTGQPLSSVGIGLRKPAQTEVPTDIPTGEPGTDSIYGIPLSVYSTLDTVGGKRIPLLIAAQSLPPPPTNPPTVASVTSTVSSGLGEGAVGIGPQVDLLAPVVSSPVPESQTVSRELPGNQTFIPVGVGASVPRTDDVVLTGESVKNPDGTVSYAVLKPDGTIAYPDGSVRLTDGRVVLPNGSIRNPDNTVSNPDGTITYPNGITEDPKSGILTKDGQVIVVSYWTQDSHGGITFANGHSKLPDGTMVIEGCIFYFNGQVRWPDGSLVNTDCSVKRPNGETWLLNGDIVLVNGNVRHPDGSITDPSGKVIKPPDPTCVKMDVGAACAKTCSKGFQCRKIPRCFPQNCAMMEGSPFEL